MKTTRLHEIDGKMYLIDPLTGEAQQVEPKDGRLVFLPVRRKMRPNFSVIEHSAIDELCETLYTGEEWRTFMTLVSLADFENRVFVKASKLAVLLLVKPPQLSRSLGRLHDNDLIYRGTFDTTDPLCVLNPYFVWRGNVERRANLLRLWTNKTATQLGEVLSTSRANGEISLDQLKRLAAKPSVEGRDYDVIE